MLVFPLLKADAASRRIFARLDETVDRAGEAMDYTASAPMFKAWSDTQFAASGGKSYGNVRAQHNVRSSAGIVSGIHFDDTARAIEFEIDVVDDGEWEKLIKGVYTGISPGGTAKRFFDAAGQKRYAVTGLSELSIVDVPCGPGATLTLLKADGAEELVAFAPVAAGPDLPLLKAMAAAPSQAAFLALTAWMPNETLAKALGDEVAAARPADAAAMPDGSFPVRDQTDIDAGLIALEKAADPDAARAHLMARATALGLAIPGDTKLEKGMGDVSQLAGLLTNMTWLAGSVASEAADEGDGSQIPARLADWIATGAVILTDMAGEESAELVANLQAAVAALPAPAAPLEKAAGFGTEGVSLLLKVSGDLAAARDQLTKAHAARAGMEAELNRYRSQPAAGGPRLRAVGRGDDVTTPAPNDPAASIAAMPDGKAKANAMMKLVMAGAVASANRA